MLLDLLFHHEQPIQRASYGGAHVVVPTGHRRTARDQPDDDLIRLVIDKWDAIERAQADGRVTEIVRVAIAAADPSPSPSKEIPREAVPAAQLSQSLSAATERNALEAAIADAAIAAAKARAQAQRNDEALAVILACL